MSIYTYNSSKAICELLEIPFVENPLLSDQELDIIPEDANDMGGTDYVSGMLWITNGEEDTYIDPKEPLPVGWKYGRSIQHMVYTDPEKWISICRESATKQWQNNSKRKKAASNKMKKYWEKNYDAMAEKARKNGKHGMIGKLSPRALLIEYNGVNYYGWRELREATGITKTLYKKYYLNGIDPTPRIGKDGPAAKTTTMDKVHKGGSA